MKAYNQNSQIMPLLMNFVVPTDIVEYVPTEFSYDDANQVTYEMTITITRSLRHPSTHKGGEYVGVDAKNEIDDTKNNRHMWF
ncbi:MAG: hypothetical protein II060_02660 [Bacteroidales bacterium]|nr:hypothetical protein [Bacteroidales bacterium]